MAGDGDDGGGGGRRTPQPLNSNMRVPGPAEEVAVTESHGESAEIETLPTPAPTNEADHAATDAPAAASTMEALPAGVRATSEPLGLKVAEMAASDSV